MGLEGKVLLMVAGLFVAGATLFLIAGNSPRLRPTLPELWRLYWLELLIVAMALLPSYFGGPIFGIGLVVFAIRGVYEIYILYYGGNSGKVNPISARLEWALFTGVLFPLLPLIAIWALRQDTDGFLWLFLIYLVVESNDAFATVFGKLFGRHRPFPRLSPRKSSEGLIGGALVALAVGVGFAVVGLDLTPGDAAGAVLVILLAGIGGDLATSALKRARGVKDFADIHVLHGGLLDIYDSFLTASAAFFLYSRLVGG